jgi:hypothetical protein
MKLPSGALLLLQSLSSGFWRGSLRLERPHSVLSGSNEEPTDEAEQQCSQR